MQHDARCFQHFGCGATHSVHPRQPVSWRVRPGVSLTTSACPFWKPAEHSFVRFVRIAAQQFAHSSKRRRCGSVDSEDCDIDCAKDRALLRLALSEWSKAGPITSVFVYVAAAIVRFRNRLRWYLSPFIQRDCIDAFIANKQYEGDIRICHRFFMTAKSPVLARARRDLNASEMKALLDINAGEMRNLDQAYFVDTEVCHIEGTGLVRQVKKGSIIQVEGQWKENPCIYCILSGAFAVYGTYHDGSQQLIRRMWPGDAFGQVAVMTGLASTTVRATVDGELWVVSPSVAGLLLSHAEAVDKEGLQIELDELYQLGRKAYRLSAVRALRDPEKNMRLVESHDILDQVEIIEKPGSKALTILLHGFMRSPEAHLRQSESLRRSVWLPCLTGLDMSSRMQFVKGLVEMARLEGYEDIDLMGFSAGAGLAAQVVLDAGERVNNLVCLDPVLNEETERDMLKDPDRFARNLLTRVNHLKIILCEPSALNKEQQGIHKLLSLLSGSSFWERSKERVETVRCPGASHFDCEDRNDMLIRLGLQTENHSEVQTSIKSMASAA